MSTNTPESTQQLQVEQLIAHRGYALRYPENTLPAVAAAIDAGARGIEIDVQFTADLEPVLMHDETLVRTAGIDRKIFDMTLEDVRKIDVCEQARLGDVHSPARVPTLGEFAGLLAANAHVAAYVEIKGHSVTQLGFHVVVERVLDALRDVMDQCTVISFLEDVVLLARKLGSRRVGWILPQWSEDAQRLLQSIQPDVVFCDHTIIPPDVERLWEGPWQWAIYEVTTVEHAEALLRRGAALIETMAIADMLRAIERASPGT